ncbi:hypothetical protein M9Y10_014621 [Tritrichomonas musculus]|uniref:Uncharacterized protein n=1 Tax=Tritrichomonas musculus TaxID=1915356 RepID=A0ABR2L388_9EUKA
MTSESYQRYRSILNNFAKLSHVCVKMDEATTNNNQNFHFFLEPPLSKTTSYLFDVVKMNGGNTQCYLYSSLTRLLPLTTINYFSLIFKSNVNTAKKDWNPEYKI